MTEQGIVFKRADELKPGDLVVSGGKYDVESTVDEEYFWALGVLTSDGAIDQMKNGVYRVRLFKSSREVTDRLAAVLNTTDKLSNDSRFKTDIFEVNVYGEKAEQIYKEFDWGEPIKLVIINVSLNQCGVQATLIKFTTWQVYWTEMDGTIKRKINTSMIQYQNNWL